MKKDLDGFDWALVKSVLAALEAGSLMGAARRIGAQQPTLSRHIAELKGQLGTPLFERAGRGVTPTAATLAIADAAHHMRQAAEALARTLADSDTIERGFAALGVSLKRQDFSIRTDDQVA